MLKVKQILPKVIKNSIICNAIYKPSHVVSTSHLINFEMGDPRDKKKTGD